VAMVATTPWTLEMLHRLPDDGNKYELVRGELFVTPAPSEAHEEIAARLTEILIPYVRQHGLGLVFHPRAVFRLEGSEVEPDLMVRQPKRRGAVDWTEAPLPLLIVEILSPTTRRRDRQQKRAFYMDAGVPEYWMVDPDEQTITRFRGDGDPETVTRELTWSPSGAGEPLVVLLAEVFA
jgi:Uma2 family endonuclease